MSLKQSEVAPGVFRVRQVTTTTDVSRETQKQFEPLRDEQLKALMLQVAKLSAEAGIELDPKFKTVLEQRTTIMADHVQRKAQAEPD